MLIAHNPRIKQALINRWKQLGLYTEQGENGRAHYKTIVLDATERNPEMKITSDRLSKWLTGYVWGGKMAGLSDEQVWYLSIRYGLMININIGEPVIENGKVVFQLPPYNETECLRRLKEVLPLLLKKPNVSKKKK